MNDDPYVDPDSGVLLNRLGLRDPHELILAEADIVTARLFQLQLRPLPGAYDVAHLQAFHRHMFGDVYPWAGDFRTVNIARSTLFGDWRHVREYLDQAFVDLAEERHLRGCPPDVFTTRVAHYLGEVNAAHPFREGNGRTQRAFFSQLARDAGWILRWSTATAIENETASKASLTGNSAPMEDLIGRILRPVPRG